jgi:PAS domain S-box-containing protein
MPAMDLPGYESESKRVLEAQLRATLDVIPAYTWYAAASGALTFVNERHADYLGLPKDHPLRFGIATGAAWDSHIAFVHPDDREEARRVWSTCLRTGCAGEFTFRVSNAEGVHRWFITRAEPLRASDGTLLYWIGVNLEIDELKQAQFYLSEGQRLAHMGSWAFNPTGFEYWSPELFRVYGLNPSGKPPTVEEYLDLVHPEDREFVMREIQKMLANNSAFEFTKRIVRPDGEIRRVRCVGIPTTSTGTAQRFVGTGLDVTEQEQLTEELRHSEAFLADAQRLSHTGSFGWKPDTGEIVWSDETYRIFEYDRSVKPTIDSVVQRVHPQDRVDLQKVIDGASRGARHFEHTYRLLLPDGRVKHVHALAHALQDASGNREFVGAVTDITERKRAEEDLRASERKYRYLVDTTPAFIHTALPDGSLDFLSRGWLEYGGLPQTDFLDWRWTAGIHPEDVEGFVDKWRAALASGEPFVAESRVRRADGEYRWFLQRNVPLRDETGKIVKWYGTGIDIEERKAAEEALRRSESYLAEAQRLSHTGSWAWRLDTDVRHWSEECYRVLGFDPRDGLPRTEELIQRIHPDDQSAFRESTKRATHNKLDEEIDYRIVHPGGAVRDIHSIGHPLFSPSGDLIEYTGTVIDVTERKRAEEELRRSEMELRQIVDLAPQFVGVFGPDREGLFVNRVALDYFGLTLEEWRQRFNSSGQPYNFQFLHPDDMERVTRDSHHALSRGAAFELEMRLRKSDGSYRWFFLRYNPLRDQEGQITRWYLTGTDIEDRKRAEDRLQQENVALREEIDKASMFEEIVGTSRALQTVLSRISKVAPSDSTVLITGETGTGKELVARAIHRRSNRASRAFVSVNCAAVPRDLIASELFGHEKGAFTGATQQRLGRFELANGGTLFLDEVGELPAETQIALLRVLQEHEFERVGGTRARRADVRVIAATNRDLQAAISAGAFRSDLYYRLNVFPIEIPALRERRADIPLLVEYFIDRYARKAGKHIATVEKKTLQVLESYPWPGNIRELQNVIERSVIVCETENFSVDESWLSRQPVASEPTRRLELSRRFAAQEKEMIEAALRESRGRVSGSSGAAAKLGIPGSTLESKIRSLKINKDHFKTNPSADRT